MAEGGNHADLADALEYIDPASLGYQEWLEVGMALHDSGMPESLWDGWSRRDPARYREGECARKWAGFGRGGKDPVRSGTIVKMAEQRGWVQPGRRAEALPWDGEIEIVDPTWLQPEELPRGETDPARELADYISALFEPDEYVGYSCESWERDGRFMPTKGCYTRTAGEILRELDRRGDIETALGSYDGRAGAWIRFNPLDGRGVADSNVAEFRYALVESDTVSKGMQLSIVRALELPCAAIVDSGGKSVHAVVRVEARDYAEYRDRVEKLYAVCRKNGLAPDTQNKNPSRLSRMPGARRGEAVQRLVSGPCGKASWDEWWEWVQETSDDLPEPENLAGAWDDMPELAPPLIDGVLRQGHKMMLVGPSKAGKSFALIELCCAIAEGAEWLGWRCAQGRVLYVNLELDPASCLRRFRDVYGAMGLAPANVGNIDVWNLRGRSMPMDRLAPPLIRRALKTRPAAVVIDPIYKVITGDENSADQMAAFCNQFDKVAQQIGCSVVVCHHHSKGFQGQKRSMDRASGSGVFARDADALLDMTGLDVTPPCRAERTARLRWEAVSRALDEIAAGWAGRMPEDMQGRAPLAIEWAEGSLHASVSDMGRLRAADAAAADAGAHATAWRIEGTLREFPAFPPRDAWFEYPAHALDPTGCLADLVPEGEPPTPAERRRRGNEGSTRTYRRLQGEKVRAMRDAIAACGADGVAPTRAAVLERIGEVDGRPVSAEMLRSWTRGSAGWSPIRISPDGTNVLVDSGDGAEALPWDGGAEG